MKNSTFEGKYPSNLTINPNVSFEIDSLPEVTDITDNKVNNIIKAIKKNYYFMRKDAYAVVCLVVDNRLFKPTIYYNLFFYVEISLKYYLIMISDLDIGEIENNKHDIDKLISNSINCDPKFEKLKYFVNRLKTINKNLDISKYYNFKYNKAIGEISFIFDMKIDKEELEMIKDVIKWLDSNI